MGLIIPKGPSWGFCVDNNTGTPSVTALGIQVTAGANDTPATAVTLLDDLAHDVEYLRIGIRGYTAVTQNGSALLDILYDPDGGTDWQTLIPGLLAGFTFATTSSSAMPLWYDFPIWIPAGASIGAQAQTAHSSNITSGRVVVQAFGANANPASWWCGQRVSAIGVDVANSIGVMHTPGASGVFSSWTNFGSTLAADAGAVQWAAQGPNTGTAVNAIFRFEFGISGQRIGPSCTRSITTAEFGWAMPAGLIFANLPGGAQLQVRGTSDNASPQDIDVAAYAVH